MSYDLSHQHYERGRSLMLNGDLHQAISEFDTSIEYSPHFKTLELLGECYLKLGEYKKAVVPLAAAATLNDQVRARSLLAKALLALGERQHARALAESVLAKSAGSRAAREVLDATKDLVL